MVAHHVMNDGSKYMWPWSLCTTAHSSYFYSPSTIEVCISHEMLTHSHNIGCFAHSQWPHQVHETKILYRIRRWPFNGCGGRLDACVNKLLRAFNGIKWTMPHVISIWFTKHVSRAIWILSICPSQCQRPKVPTNCVDLGRSVSIRESSTERKRSEWMALTAIFVQQWDCILAQPIYHFFGNVNLTAEPLLQSIQLKDTRGDCTAPGYPLQCHNNFSFECFICFISTSIVLLPPSPPAL